MPGYPIVKRGIYYACRKLSAQLDKIGKNGEGYKNLEKVYSIWICLDKIPQKLQNTISYYKIQNYKNEGIKDPDIKVNADDADLMEIVIIRLGNDDNLEKGLMDLLHGVFSGDNDKVLSYIPGADNINRKKEVYEMLNMISYAEEKGEKKGENRLIKLMRLLYKNGQEEDVEKITEDDNYREELYKKYNL